MTLEELKALELPIEANSTTLFYTEAALDWLIANTTLPLAKDDLESIKQLPAGAKIFISHFYDVMSINGTVTSESIGGMSQTFSNASKASQLYQLASELLKGYLKGQVRSVPNTSKWV